MMLVSGVDVTVETPGGRWGLSTQRYAPDVTGGGGEQHIESFALDPWPTWVFRLPDGTRGKAQTAAVPKMTRSAPRSRYRIAFSNTRSPPPTSTGMVTDAMTAPTTSG